MRRPVVRGDLVADQIVHRLRVGHAQERLGETHQRHALLRRQAVFGQENFHQLPVGGGSHSAHKIGGAGGDIGAQGLGKPGRSNEARQDGTLFG
jgi:hypothetical protein